MQRSTLHFSRSPAAVVAVLGSVVLAFGAAAPVRAQHDQATEQAAARIRQVLPADIADRILAQIAAAGARGLPEAPLEQRVLKFAAKGVRPTLIESSLTEHVARMAAAADALRAAHGPRVGGDEVEAGAEAIRKGVRGADVRALATSAPSGRSMAVPLYVVSTLIDRGLPADEALARVRDRLRARADDAELERLGDDPAARAGRGASGRGVDDHAGRGRGRDGGDDDGGREQGGGSPTARPGTDGPLSGGPTGGRSGKSGKQGRGRP